MTLVSKGSTYSLLLTTYLYIYIYIWIDWLLFITLLHHFYTSLSLFFFFFFFFVPDSLWRSYWIAVCCELHAHGKRVDDIRGEAALQSAIFHTPRVRREAYFSSACRFIIKDFALSHSLSSASSAHTSTPTNHNHLTWQKSHTTRRRRRRLFPLFGPLSCYRLIGFSDTSRCSSSHLMKSSPPQTSPPISRHILPHRTIPPKINRRSTIPSFHRYSNKNGNQINIRKIQAHQRKESKDSDRNRTYNDQEFL